MKREVCSIASIGLLVLGTFSIAAAQSPRDAGKLSLRQRIERQLGPGQTDVFTIEVSAGQFFNVVARKKGVDAVLYIVDPGGNTLVTANSTNYTLGLEPASSIALASGTYSVRVASAERSTETGRYEIELTDLREPTEKDKTQLRAQVNLFAAAAKDRAGDRANRSAAIPLYEDAASIWRELDDVYEEGLCFHRIGFLYSELGEQQRALDYFNKALSIRRAAGDRIGEANTLNGVGVARHRLGDQQKALDAYQESLEIRRTVGDRTGEVSTLTNIAIVHSALGEQTKAMEYCEQALSIKRALGDRAGAALALNNIANVYTALGEQQKALDTYQQVLAIWRAISDRSGEARTLTVLANVYRDLGAEERALEYYQQSLAVSRASDDHSVDADTLMGMGDVYFFLGEKKKSLDAYDRSLSLKRAAGDRSGEALALIGIGNVYSDLAGRQKAADANVPGEKQKGLDYYQQALSIGRIGGDFAVQVFALMGTGVVYSALGDKPKAMDHLNQALFFLNLARFRPGEGWARYEMARVERDRGNLTQALALATKARDIIEELRSKVVSPDLRASFFAAVQDCYGLEMDVLMRMHAADPSKNYEAEALTTSERARARVLLEALGEARADIREGADPVLLERERAVQVQLNAKEMARMQMLGTKHTPEQSNEIETAVRDLAAQYEEVNTQIRVHSPHYAALKFPQSLGLDGIRKEVLDPDTLLLEYALGDQRSFLWAVSSSGLTSVVLPKRTDVEEAAKRFHDALIDPSGAMSLEVGKALSRILLGGVASSLGHKRLLIVADGALQYLPFAALPDPDGFQQPLMANHELVNVPSASTLAVLRRETANRKPAPKTLAVLADPVFSADDSRVSRVQPRPASVVTRDAAELKRSLSDLGLSGFRLPRLPGTRREAAGIVSLVPEADRKQALDFEANRSVIASPEMSQYRILHLATHGLLNTIHPELSGIVLSLVNRKGQPQDGFLRLHEIYNLKLAADLVVLSACQTGLGKEIHGEGLVGLTRGFMYAGAPRVLASLWKVDDRATAELMKRFYTSMLGREALRPAAALREAQIELWKTNGWKHPYYWAAFTLQGEWK